MKSYLKVILILIVAGVIEDLTALYFLTGRLWIEPVNLLIIGAVAIVFGLIMHRLHL